MAAGAAEAIVQALFRARGFILIVLAGAFAVALIEIFRSGLPSWEFAPRIASVLLGVAVVFFIHLRNFQLALLATLAPLPGLLIVLAVSGTPAGIVVSYVLGMIVALFAADDMALRMAEGTPPQSAALAALNASSPASLAIMAAGAMLVAVHWWLGGVMWFAIGAISAVLTAVTIVLSVGPYLAASENGIAGFNRVREIEQRLASRLATVAHPRWGASIAGIVAVLCALGYFGAVGIASVVPHAGRWALFAVIIFGVASLSVARDWRRTIAIVFSLGPPTLLALWAIVRLHEIFTEPLRDRFEIVSLCGFALTVFVAGRAADYAHSGNDAAMASARSMERMGGVVVFAATASALVLIVGAPAPVAPLVLIVMSAAAAILFQPAVAISLESLFPRRETIEARYRVR